MPDKCPRCGTEDCGSYNVRGNEFSGGPYLVETENCLRRQNAALRNVLVSIRRCGVECSECRDEIDNALRPYDQTEVADDDDSDD